MQKRIKIGLTVFENNERFAQKQCVYITIKNI